MLAVSVVPVSLSAQFGSGRDTETQRVSLFAT